MSVPAVFQGNYANIITRKTRGVCVVEIELAIEQMQAFIAAFGAPLPGKEIPVALARLDPAKAASEPRAASVEAPASAFSTGLKERRAFNELPFSQQAGMRCADSEFQRFLQERYDYREIMDTNGAALLVRAVCKVDTRSHIKAGMPSGDYWQALDRAFLYWKHAVPIGEPVR